MASDASTSRPGPRRTRRLAAVGAVAALLLSVAGLTVVPVSPAVAALSCGAFGSSVSDIVNPRTRAELLTDQPSDLKSAPARGFTTGRGQPFTAAAKSGAGLSGVHRLYQETTGNYFYTAYATELARAVKRHGYVDQGVVFYVSKTSAGCLIPVYSFRRAGIHRYATTLGDRAILRDTGWRSEGVRFYAGRPRVDTTFVLSVLPDTQQEVLRAKDTRFIDRSRWLIAAKAAFDLRFVTHTGDVVNWDTSDHLQYKRAAVDLAPLSAAGIPYSLSPGNHDTAAVCTGGGACDPHQTRALVRHTSSFNRYLDHGTADLGGRFEAGRVDNTYSVFSAGGAHWLVLNLELWPRTSVVTWAQRVVSTHPDDNVIVVTHSYLTSAGNIYDSGGYGGVSPQYLYDHLIRIYPNIRVVLSGHVGLEATRTDTGDSGNKIVSLMLTMHDNYTNPLRLIEINTAANSLDTWVYAPYTRQSYPAYSRHFPGLSWIPS